MAGEKDRPAGEVNKPTAVVPTGVKTGSPAGTSEPKEKSMPRRPQGAGSETGELADPLGQLREILCGAIHRELERRLARVDAHMASRSNDVESESQRRTEVLETHLRKETDALTARLERENAEHHNTMRAMAREQREAVTALEQRLAKAEDAIARIVRDLRSELLEQAKSFLDEIRRVRHEFAETLDRELGIAGETLEEADGGGREERATP
jgi:hypothetical protein